MSDTETVTIVYTVVVAEDELITQDDTRTNSVELNRSNGSDSASALPITIQEPVLLVEKDAPNTNDDGQRTITYEISIEHDTDSPVAAFDLIFSDDLV